MTSDVIFLDFEASSLKGWPIEVGMAWIEAGNVQVWSTLIKPRDSWSDDLWDPAAERVHGIARSSLMDAPDADVVSIELQSRLRGRFVVSDAPEFDGHWLECLTGEAVDLHRFDVIAFKTFGDKALDLLFERLARLRAPHRAGPDASRLAKAWLRAQEVTEATRQ